MQSQFFYYSSIKRYIEVFGSIFNNIQVQHGNSNIRKARITYASKEKFIEKKLSIISDKDKGGPTAKVENILPAISFELVGLNYDADRQTSVLNTNVQNVGGVHKNQLAPVAYNFDFVVSLYGRYGEEVLQMVEQILPFFRPSFNITIKENETMGITKRDIPVLLTGTEIDNDYTEDTDTRRRIEATLNFTLKGWIYPNITDNTNIIKKAVINFGFQGQPDEEFETIEWLVDPLSETIDNWDGSVRESIGISDNFIGEDGDSINKIWGTPLGLGSTEPPLILNNAAVNSSWWATSPVGQDNNGALFIPPIEFPSPLGCFVEADCTPPTTGPFGNSGVLLGLRMEEPGSGGTDFSGYVMHAALNGKVQILHYNHVFSTDLMYETSDNFYVTGDVLRFEVEGPAVSVSSPQTQNDVGTFKLFKNNVLIKSGPLWGPDTSVSPILFTGAINPEPLGDPNLYRIGLCIIQGAGILNSVRYGILR